MAAVSKIPMVCAIFALVFITSCHKEEDPNEILRNLQQENLEILSGSFEDDLDFSKTSIGKVKKNYFLKKKLTGTEETEIPQPVHCAPTAMLDVLLKHLTPIAQDELAYQRFEYYQYLNFVIAITDESRQYFGADGEFTNHVRKVQRDLERFWGMSGMVRVKGQHNTTLNDREKLADALFILMQDLEEKDEVYPMVDELLYFNSISPNLPESLFFSSDGFSHRNGLIIVGDGLIQMIAEAGVDAKISWTGILAHEWAHQIQLHDYLSGKAQEVLPTPLKELEADFFAGYYLTHKRGGTYNWKKAEEFFELFFLLGDCGPEGEVQHGTPAQRMEAAKLGYRLAMEAKKKGHILSAQEVHEEFLSKMNLLL